MEVLLTQMPSSVNLFGIALLCVLITSSFNAFKYYLSCLFGVPVITIFIFVALDEDLYLLFGPFNDPRSVAIQYPLVCIINKY